MYRTNCTERMRPFCSSEAECTYRSTHCKEVTGMKIIRPAAQAACVKTGRVSKSVPGHLS
ncbi:hypothetical protein [Paenibacillus sp. OSY-SE]|uniref:hypothetical protein n=1 Tax=Paenibacillus sp. OSY-SE TaxID=1196323 RepID=UPI0012F91891|nr:hypothetical protein [Paenibacillus sp. OSY-SE]